MSAINVFDAFRDNSGSLIYNTNNRIPAIYNDMLNILIYICFLTLFVAFMIISPGIRKERYSTTICITVSLFIGAVILSTQFGTSWHVAESSISSPYKAFSKERLYSTIGVKIGLNCVNVTLKAHSIHKNHEDINYNERFYFNEPSDMKKEHRKALIKGLPYPILTITEYLSQDAEGFCWGRRYRLAGHYANFILWITFASWVLMNILLCAVPRYGAYTMQLTGFLLLCTNLTYFLLLPKVPLLIPYEGAQLKFQLGWCFWIVCIAGVLALFVGSIYVLLDVLYPNKFSTILEVDYDTPYRYFVGNDAHFLSSADLLGKTNNLLTDSKNISNSISKNTLNNLILDASKTATLMSMPIQDNNNKENQQNFNNNLSSKEYEKGSDNVAFEDTEKLYDQNQKSSKQQDQIIRLDESNQIKELELTRSNYLFNNIKNNYHQSTRRLSNQLNSSNLSSDDSDVTTTIINGKRAVSLHNFDKFEAQKQRELFKSKHYQQSSFIQDFNNLN